MNFFELLFSFLKRAQKDDLEHVPQKFPQSVAQTNILQITDEPVEVIVESFEGDILYVDIKIGLNVRETPEVSDNKIDVLKFAEEVRVIEKNENQWFRINYRANKEGWVASQYLTEENPKTSTSEIKRKMSEGLVFKDGGPNLAHDENTKKLRELINNEFGHTEASGISLQCVEYVQYAVKLKTGVDISWPADRPRHGGLWPTIFQKYHMYKVVEDPALYSAMSFANPNFNTPYGHVAFVDEIFNDGSIKISEANWPSKGIYNERILSKEQWKQEKWGAKFIDFT